MIRSLLLALLLIASGAALGASHDVTFTSKSVTLSGTVFIPTQTPVVAGVVWIDGAGQTKRNPGLGQLLAQRGFAVLTYDKRGVGQSGGVYAGPEVGTNNVSAENLALLAQDAAAALHALRQEKELRNVPLGFLGGSQAGWIAPVAALERREARFMVFWSGAVETTHENIRFERNGVAGDLSWTNFDPRPALDRLKIPGHWIFGGKDRNVDVRLSIARLDALIARGHSNYSYRIFDEYDHWLGGEREDVMAPTLEWIRAVASQAR